MDTRTGEIYESRKAALAAGVPEDKLVMGTREMLEDLKRRLDLHSKYEPHQGKQEITRRLRQAEKAGV